jgi:hypothetical protein
MLVNKCWMILKPKIMTVNIPFDLIQTLILVKRMAANIFFQLLTPSSSTDYCNMILNNMYLEVRINNTFPEGPHDFDDIIIPTRGEAELVLDKLIDLTIDYREATVADLYELTGVDAAFTDRKYGWRDLRSAKVVRCKTGYIIDLPPTELLD